MRTEIRQSLIRFAFHIQLYKLSVNVPSEDFFLQGMVMRHVGTQLQKDMSPPSDIRKL